MFSWSPLVWQVTSRDRAKNHARLLQKTTTLVIYWNCICFCLVAKAKVGWCPCVAAKNNSLMMPIYRCDWSKFSPSNQIVRIGRSSLPPCFDAPQIVSLWKKYILEVKWSLSVPTKIVPSYTSYVIFEVCLFARTYTHSYHAQTASWNVLLRVSKLSSVSTMSVEDNSRSRNGLFSTNDQLLSSWAGIDGRKSLWLRHQRSLKFKRNQILTIEVV